MLIKKMILSAFFWIALLNTNLIASDKNPIGLLSGQESNNPISNKIPILLPSIDPFPHLTLPTDIKDHQYIQLPENHIFFDQPSAQYSIKVGFIHNIFKENNLLKDFETSPDELLPWNIDNKYKQLFTIEGTNQYEKKKTYYVKQISPNNDIVARNEISNLHKINNDKILKKVAAEYDKESKIKPKNRGKRKLHHLVRYPHIAPMVLSFTIASSGLLKNTEDIIKYFVVSEKVKGKSLSDWLQGWCDKKINTKTVRHVFYSCGKVFNNFDKITNKYLSENSKSPIEKKTNSGTIIHGDGHLKNIFFDLKTRTVSFIDNDTMAYSLDGHYIPLERNLHLKPYWHHNNFFCLYFVPLIYWNYISDKVQPHVKMLKEFIKGYINQCKKKERKDAKKNIHTFIQSEIYDPSIKVVKTILEQSKISYDLTVIWDAVKREFPNQAFLYEVFFNRIFDQENKEQTLIKFKNILKILEKGHDKILL